METCWSSRSPIECYVERFLESYNVRSTDEREAEEAARSSDIENGARSLGFPLVEPRTGLEGAVLIRH